MQTFTLWFARILFCVLLVGLTYLALSNSKDDLSAWWDFIVWDKAKHFLAYLVLSIVGAVAFPKIPFPILFLALLAQSAVIEAAQPYFGRSRDVADLMANFGGILAMTAVLIASSIREWLVKPREGDIIVPAEIISRSLMDR